VELNESSAEDDFICVLSKRNRKSVMRLSLSGRKPPRAKHKENPSAMVKVSGVTHRIHESPPPKKKHIGRKKK